MKYRSAKQKPHAKTCRQYTITHVRTLMPLVVTCTEGISQLPEYLGGQQKRNMLYLEQQEAYAELLLRATTKPAQKEIHQIHVIAASQETRFWIKTETIKHPFLPWLKTSSKTKNPKLFITFST